jgi:hypothetical protein
MKVNPETSGRLVMSEADRSHVDGTSFSAGRSFAVSRGGPIDRITMLEDLSRGRNVLHVGFADHSGILEEKRAQGLWLHDRLVSVARRCAGIDIDTAAVDAIRSLGVTDVHAGDVTTLADDHPLLAQHWDVVVLGEVVEHLPAPAAFLRAVAARFQGRVDELVVTTPNAWSLGTLRDVVRGRETINTDHRFWFTPFTMAKLASDAGLACVEVRVVEYWPQVPKPGIRRRVYEAVTTRRPMLRACCVLRVTHR